MEKLTTIIIRFSLEGIHRWKDAGLKEPDVEFLQFPHRHMFHFEVRKVVEHDDRDIEIILFKRSVIDYLQNKYGSDQGNFCDFKTKSCEMLAEEIVDAFECMTVQCLEDNENGAHVTRMI